MKFQATALVFLAACAQALVIPKEFSNLAKKCAIPDGILTAIHTTNCDASVPIQVSKTTILKTSDGTPMYPVNVKIPMTLDLIASNNGNVEYQANRVHVKLFEFSENWLTGALLNRGLAAPNDKEYKTMVPFEGDLFGPDKKPPTLAQSPPDVKPLPNHFQPLQNKGAVPEIINEVKPLPTPLLNRQANTFNPIHDAIQTSAGQVVNAKPATEFIPAIAKVQTPLEGAVPANPP
uniref:Major sperm protein n=1 Tax=Rhabditophanes sp. KR3021 TaxID=114890 RepID=A0AC35UC68_9BILA